MFPPLASPTPSRLKRGALAAFRVVRFVQATVRSVPDVVTSAGRDVADAWRESARPNA